MKRDHVDNNYGALTTITLPTLCFSIVISATLYGNGVYFAVESSYSHNYAVPNQNKERRMFLVDVITGEYAKGERDMIDTPERPGASSADQYDSVVNQMENPSIFVVFKDASAYPLYILTYC